MVCSVATVDPAQQVGQTEKWYFDTETVLRDELDTVAPRPQGGNVAREKRADEARLAALCLSGGGIRSAAFCLGAIQALAKHKMLSRFHYLSTVSGGGFAGGWLQNYIAEKGSVYVAQAELGSGDADALKRLREYTNYLTPEVGLFSKDTWASIVLYIRNLALIWLVIFPVLLSAILFLIIFRGVLDLARIFNLVYIPIILGSILLFYGVYNACSMIPSHRGRLRRKPDFPVRYQIDYAAPGSIEKHIVLPILLWSLVVPASIGAFFVDCTTNAGAAWWPLILLGASYFVSQIAAYVLAALAHRAPKDPDKRSFRTNLVPWIIASAVAAIGIALGCRIGIDAIAGTEKFDPHKRDLSQVLLVAAPLLLITGHLFQSVIFVGIRRTAKRVDLDREWIARADGQILLCATIWTAVALCSLSLAEVILGKNSWFSQAPAWLAAFTTLLSGPFAAWLGKQVVAQAQDVVKFKPLSTVLVSLLNLMAVLFAISLSVALGVFLQYILGEVQLYIGQCSGRYLYTDDFRPDLDCKKSQLYKCSPIVIQLIILLLLIIIMRLFGSINVNRFSMHAVYRNRLTRAFLGSSRELRDADPFTDFDERDSPLLSNLKRARLFPIVNLTLNLTDVDRRAWAERKAAPFVATPLACGSAALSRHDEESLQSAHHEPLPAADGRIANAFAPGGAYIKTMHYAGQESSKDTRNRNKGPKLGGVLTISGAAVSPHWGYHSSPVIAFLMTMFNFRLGAWLPNPAVTKKKDAQLAKPLNSISALFSELVGRSSDKRQAVYLSDGGHFDNLGLYEMLRRRCARIVVIDAGQDEFCQFLDLGAVIRKAEIDGLVESIDMGEMRIVTRKEVASGKRSLGYAVGRIKYKEADDIADLIYIKPSYVVDLPISVKAYGESSPSFPHESTAHQWFSESQFESYRALGFHQVDLMFGARFRSLSDWVSHLDDTADDAAFI